MRADDLDAVLSVWAVTDGVQASVGDTPAELERYLARNPGMSHVVVIDGVVVGATLAGHDGRRGFLYHVAMRQEYQGRKLGRRMVDACVEALRQAGIRRAYIFVLRDNAAAKRFWDSGGWIGFNNAEPMGLNL